MDHAKFQYCYSTWLESPLTTFAKIILFEETHFIFEISRDSSPSKKSLNFVIKFLTSVRDKEIKKIFEVLFEIIDQRKEDILQVEKDAGRCDLMRVLVEVVVGRIMPSRLDVIGSSLKTICNIRIERKNGWQMNGNYNILCYGRVDTIIELHIFEPNNSTDVPDKKVNKIFYIQSYDTLAEVVDKMRSTDFIKEDYRIGSFFLEGGDVFEDQSAKLTACTTMFPNPNDICCKIVLSNPSC